MEWLGNLGSQIPEPGAKHGQDKGEACEQWGRQGKVGFVSTSHLRDAGEEASGGSSQVSEQ